MTKFFWLHFRHGFDTIVKLPPKKVPGDVAIFLQGPYVAVKKTHTYALMSFAAAMLLIFAAAPAYGQKSTRKERQRAEKAENDKRTAPNPAVRQNSGYLGYRVEEGDTVYYGSIEPSWSFASGRSARSSEWRKYYRLVYNFNKVYPYALVGKKLERKADSTIAATHMSRREKEKYVNSLQKELLNAFEKPLRHLTISQGALLIRLVDREVGNTGYDIIKDYKSGLAAHFWQGIAKIFKNDLKTHYDPNGVDKQTEELVQMWQSGKFPSFYFSIFFEYPRETVIPEKYR